MQSRDDSFDMLVLTDLHIIQEAKNETFLGNVYQDSSKYLIDVLFQNLQKHIENEYNISYFVNLGDIAQHQANKSIQKDVISFYVKHVNKLFNGKNVTKINCLGNNEGNGNYNFSILPNDEQIQFLLNDCKLKDLFNNQKELESFIKHSFYFIDDQSRKIRFISLNSVLLSMAYMQVYKPKYLSESDVAGQLAWLDKVLSEASNLGYQILLFSHIPFGVNGWNGLLTTSDQITQNYEKLIYKYKDIIIAELFGHYHQDLLRYHQVGLEQYVPGFVCPSVSQSNGNNPGYRIFRFSRNMDGKWEVENYWSYYLNTQLYNQLLQVEKEQIYFQLQYSFVQQYQAYLEDLHHISPTAENIKMITEGIQSDPQLFNEYYTNMKTLQIEQVVAFACETTYLFDNEIQKCTSATLLLLMRSNAENNNSPLQI